MELNNEQKIIKMLFKDFKTHYNSRSISKVIGISHAGAFKIMKKLEKKEMILPEQIGRAVIYSLNFNNPLVLREVEMALTIEAWNYKRWTEEFKGLENISHFTILFGSIIVNEKSARDIDILVVAEKSNFSRVREIIEERNKLSNKKIHLILQNPDEFKKDAEHGNKVISDMIKKGIVLFGQNNLVKILKNDTNEK